MPGFGAGAGRSGREIAAALVRLLEAFEEGTGGAARPIVDLNFNLEPEGILHVGRALEPFGLLWLEVDLYDAAALAPVRRSAADADLLGREPLHAARVPAVPRGRRAGRRLGGRDLERLPPGEEDRRHGRDVRGHVRAAQLLQPPRDVISAQWCAAIPNVRILEFDVDDVPWRDELAAAGCPSSATAAHDPVGTGLGRRVDEDVLRAHPWPPA